MRNEHAAWKNGMGTRHAHAVWKGGMYMKHRHKAWTCSLNMRGIDMDMQCGHAFFSAEWIWAPEPGFSCDSAKRGKSARFLSSRFRALFCFAHASAKAWKKTGIPTYHDNIPFKFLHWTLFIFFAVSLPIHLSEFLSLSSSLLFTFLKQMLPNFYQ
jgi:hypothetical protein